MDKSFDKEWSNTFLMTEKKQNYKTIVGWKKDKSTLSSFSFLLKNIEFHFSAACVNASFGEPTHHRINFFNNFNTSFYFHFLYI